MISNKWKQTLPVVYISVFKVGKEPLLFRPFDVVVRVIVEAIMISFIWSIKRIEKH